MKALLAICLLGGGLWALPQSVICQSPELELPDSNSMHQLSDKVNLA